MVVDKSKIATDVYYLMSEPHYPLGHILMEHAESLRLLGLLHPLEQRLGEGAFGTAYSTPLGGGTTLKLTRDVTEAQAATLLKGRKSKRIVHVHGVWAVPGSFRDGLRGWYLVHRELLEPMNKQDTAAVEILFQIYSDDYIRISLPRSVRQHNTIHRWRALIQAYVMDTSRGALVTDEGDVVVTSSGKLVKRAVQLLLQVGQAVAEMHKAGIDWEDIHPDNMMRNASGKLVIGDIGYGEMHQRFSDVVPVLRPDVVADYVSSFSKAPSLRATT